MVKKRRPTTCTLRGTKIERLNPNLPKQIRKALDTEREVLIVAKDCKDIEELQKSIRVYLINAEDENEYRTILTDVELIRDGQGDRPTGYFAASFARGFCRLVLPGHFTIGNWQTVKAAHTACERKEEHSLQD